jgi:hypothetical protein
VDLSVVVRLELENEQVICSAVEPAPVHDDVWEHDGRLVVISGAGPLHQAPLVVDCFVGAAAVVFAVDVPASLHYALHVPPEHARNRAFAHGASVVAVRSVSSLHSSTIRCLARLLAVVSRSIRPRLVILAQRLPQEDRRSGSSTTAIRRDQDRANRPEGCLPPPPADGLGTCESSELAQD